MELPVALVLLAALLTSGWGLSAHVWRSADDAIAAERQYRLAQQGGR